MTTTTVNDLDAAESAAEDIAVLLKALRYSPVTDDPTPETKAALDQAVVAWHAGFTLPMQGTRPTDGDDARFMLRVVTSLLADALRIASVRIDAVQAALNAQVEGS